MYTLPVLVTVVLALLGSTLPAQNVKVNPPLAPEVLSGDVQEFAFTPDGTRVVYSADRGQTNRFELYSRLLDGSQASLLLSAPMQPQGDVMLPQLTFGSGFRVGAGGRVAYLADESIDGIDELFSVPADGSSSRIRLSQAGPRVTDIQLDSSGARVAYKHTLDPIGILRVEYGSLHVAPIDGSAAPVTLWPQATGTLFWFSPDGLRVAFSDVENWFTLFPSIAFGSIEHLYVIPIDGSTAAVHLAETRGKGNHLLYSSFEKVMFTSDGAHVACGETVIDQIEETTRHVVHGVRLDASQPAIPIGGYFSNFELDTRVPQHVVFNSNGMRSALIDGSMPVMLSSAGSSAPMLLGNDVFFSTGNVGNATFFRAPSDGSLPTVQLNAPVPGFVPGFVIASPQAIAFRQSNPPQVTYLLPSTGGTPVPLHPPLTQGRVDELIVDPSGQHLLLRGSLDVAAIFELYSVDLADLSLVQLSHEQPPDSDVVEARFAPGGQVVYRTRTTAGRAALFTVSADASTSPMQLNEPAATGNVGGDVGGFRVTRDGRTLVYRADQGTDDHHDLYAVDARTPGLPVLLTANVGSVEPQFSLLEPPGLVLFQTQAAGFTLQVTDLRGSPPTVLDSASVPFQDFATAHDGRRLVYRKFRVASPPELWSVLLDGSSPPVQLLAQLGNLRGVSAFRVAPDGTVVFLADLRDEIFELFAVSAKGGMPLRISGSMISRGDVDAFEIDPTGKFVAFTADAAVDGKLELFAVPLDGGLPPERRSGVMPILGDVTRLAFAGDRRHLVYVADQINDQGPDLFSTPILGSLGTTGGLRRTSLGTTLLSRHPGARNVQTDFLLSADGTTIVYRVGLGTGGFELFRVPVDGSARPSSLSGGRNVVAAALAPDQGHVVYLADQLVDERFELFSVPLTGGTPVPLASPQTLGDVVDFAITPDSIHVVFRADRDADEVFELYRVPIDGSAPAVRLNGPMVPGGDAQPGFVALDGRTFYMADQERDEVVELFLTR